MSRLGSLPELPRGHYEPRNDLHHTSCLVSRIVLFPVDGRSARYEVNRPETLLFARLALIVARYVLVLVLVLVVVVVVVVVIGQPLLERELGSAYTCYLAPSMRFTLYNSFISEMIEEALSLKLVNLSC